MDNGQPARAERQPQAVRDRLATRAEQVRQLAQLSDTDLVTVTPASTSLSRPLPQMEMQRRLKAATETLTAETIRSRESSDSAARKLERLTRWLIWFTAALVLLTLALVALTAVVASKG